MSKVKNEPKCKNGLLQAIRSLLEHRAFWLYLLCDEAKKRGLKVAVNGVNYSGLSKEKLQMFLEESPYMMDFVGDERGHIVAINFDKITDF